MTGRLQRSRNLKRSREEILGATFQLVFAHGFQGVSIDDILKKTTLTKGAFFHQFANKQELGYALIEEVITPMILTRWIDPLRAYPNPIVGILELMEELIGRGNPAHRKLGCPLNNLVQEMAPIDQGFRSRLQSALKLWIRETERELKRAKRTGHLRPGVSPKDAAHFIVMAHEGIYGMLKGLDDPRAFRKIFAPVRQYLESISTKA